MLGEDFVKKAQVVDEILGQFGHVYKPGFWCRKHKLDFDPVCIKCPEHLDCHAKFQVRMRDDELETGRFDWGLMVLTGEVTPDFFTDLRGGGGRVNGWKKA